MARGAVARQNRSARRTGQSEKRGVSKAPAPTLDASEALVAGASGKTDLPLSDRDTGWDAGAAEKTLSEAQYPDAHFWRDPDGDPATLAAYKLPFASAEGGTLTAVWKGVTAGAAAIQGARGGVDIPAGDVAAVKAKIAAYYDAAAKKYEDENIKPPWEASADEEAAAEVEEAAINPVEFQHTTSCECGHPLSGHTGVDGPCTFEDGRGRCSCSSFAEASITAAGEMVWGPEDGFKDILCDLCEQLGVYEEDYCAVDVTLALDKALVKCGEHDEHGGMFFVAPITADAATGDVVLSPQTEWVEVDKAWISEDEAMTAAAVEETLPPEHQPGVEMPQRHPSPPEPVSEQPTNATLKRWEATIAPEGTLTDDGRAFAPGSISWRELPLTLMAQLATAEGHDGAEVAGRIDRIWREGNLLRATGVFDEGDYGQEIARMVGDGTLRGVSVDLAVRQFEVGAQADWFDEDGNWTPPDEQAAEEEEGSDLLDLLFGGEDTIFVVTDAVIGAVTVCSFPAFAEASIALTAAAHWTFTFQGGVTVVETDAPAGEDAGLLVASAAPEEPEEALTAAAAGMVPVAPPVEWFDPPNLDELTPIVVTAEGRVYGHAAAWDTCHIGIPDVCTTAPRTRTNYAYFHLGEIECDGGERVACGKITLGTGHADKHLGFREAMAHYDNTGSVVADVICGEDEFGPWVAGGLRPDADAATVRELRAAVLSGDWRNVNGNLELVALLAVNVPGFPVPRQRALIASSGEGDEEHVEVLALVAAGHVYADSLFTDEERERIAELRAAASGVDEFKLLAVRAVTAASLRPPDDEFALLAARARAEG